VITNRKKAVFRGPKAKVAIQRNSGFSYFADAACTCVCSYTHMRRLLRVYVHERHTPRRACTVCKRHICRTACARCFSSTHEFCVKTCIQRQRLVAFSTAERGEGGGRFEKTQKCRWRAYAGACPSGAPPLRLLLEQLTQRQPPASRWRQEC
jgi:hypothetical protein